MDPKQSAGNLAVEEAAAAPHQNVEHNGTEFISYKGSELALLTCSNLGQNKGQIVKEILSGMTVSLAQLSEAVAFSLVALVSPLVGLQSGWMICVITALLGGRPVRSRSLFFI